MDVAATPALAERELFMQRAIAQARRSLAAGGPPVGACLVREGAVIAEAQNGVIAELDVTAHAEMRVLRQACASERALRLSGCELYVTLEPCLMCYSASAYAGLSAIYFGAPLQLMQAITGDELGVPPDGLAGENLPAMHGGLLVEECTELLQAWKR